MSSGKILYLPVSRSISLAGSSTVKFGRYTLAVLRMHPPCRRNSQVSIDKAKTNKRTIL